MTPTGGNFQRRHRNCIDCVFFNADQCDLGVPRTLIDDPNLFVCARNEIRPPESVPHKITGFHTRKWFDDPSMVSEAMRTGRDIPVTDTDVVLDIGAHIGSFGFMTLVNGARRCVFVEADPMNWAVLNQNAGFFDRDRAEVMESALVGDVDRPSTITLWRTGYSGCSSTLWRKRTFYTTVPTSGFTETLRRVRPTIMKVDVEGAEHSYNWAMMNPELRLIHIEVHNEVSGGFLPAAARIERVLWSQGFKTTYSKERRGFIVLVLERKT